MCATLSTAPSPRALGPAAGKLRRHDRFVGEIAAVLVVKAIAIALIWLAFFSSPSLPSDGMDAQRVAEHVAAPAAATHGQP